MILASVSESMPSLGVRPDKSWNPDFFTSMRYLPSERFASPITAFDRSVYPAGHGDICGLRSQREGYRDRRRNQQKKRNFVHNADLEQWGSPSSCHFNPVSAAISDR